MVLFSQKGYGRREGRRSCLRELNQTYIENEWSICTQKHSFDVARVNKGVAGASRCKLG